MREAGADCTAATTTWRWRGGGRRQVAHGVAVSVAIGMTITRPAERVSRCGEIKGAPEGPESEATM